MRGRYSFWTYVLSCLVAVLAITSYFIPQPGEWEVWILGALSNALIVVSVMAINTKSVNNIFNTVTYSNGMLGANGPLYFIDSPRTIYGSIVWKF